MPYNPGVNSIGGQLIGQGLASAGQSLAEGMKTYFDNKVKNAALQGQNETLAQQFRDNPELMKYAPAGLDKFLKKSAEGGGLTLKDNIILNGSLNAAIQSAELVNKQRAAQLAQAQGQQGLQAGAVGLAQSELAYQNALRQADALNKMYYGQGAPSQPAPPQANAAPQDNPFFGRGAGVLTSKGLQALAPQAVSAFSQNPSAADTIANWVRRTGSAPPPEIVVDAQKRLLDQPTEAGWVVKSVNPNTNVVTLANVHAYGRGTKELGDKTMEWNPASGPFQGRLLDAKTLEPVGAAQDNKGLVQQFTDESMRNMRIKDPEHQKLISEAATQLGDLQEKKFAIAALGKAVDDYTQSPFSFPLKDPNGKPLPFGGNFNFATGTELGLNIRQMLGDPSGKALKGASGPLFKEVMQDTKNLRNLQEMQMLTRAVPDPTDPNEVLINKYKFAQAVTDNAAERKQYYLGLLSKGYLPGDAKTMTIQAVPFPEYVPAVLKDANGGVRRADAAFLKAYELAKKHPDDPHSKLILKTTWSPNN